MKYLSIICLLLISTSSLYAQRKKDAKEETSGIESSTVSGLSFRLVGPALTSGRIADIAVDPNNQNVWYVAAASGGVWKTTNHGTTFNPIFDGQASYSIGCITLAPTNSNTVWVGSGENNNQRSVAYGDGVYKSVDGGKSFKNMGLKTSEHIGKIIVHPTNENIVWVAAYGPVWSKGGERGVYKTTDGGETWERTLEISEHTGIAEIAIDPSNPDVLYASAHQRRRREWTYIGGGPESGLHKSIDGGVTWKEINKGLPKGKMGRIGIAVSPVDPNYVYAIIEARDGKGGFFRSTNRGENWSKMSSYKTSGNYYQEIICDLTDKDKVFSMNTWLHHTEDGGKNFKRTGESKKHVDNHCIWINPNDPNHWIVGCDGGLYETFNHAKDWKYYSNLPIIQFYKVATDNAEPFYNIYGGTQDNNSMGGPSASINNAGILNSDWFITNGGDGFESAIDPNNPNIVYAQAQYGWLVRYDKTSGEKTPIQPMPAVGEPAYRWNWDSPIIISKHDSKTVYFAANKLFKSTNRGDDWETISPDLSQQMDRNTLPVMDQVWSIDAVMKNKSTTIYGNIVALDESPITKGLLYVGTDDGLIQVSTDDGGTWTKMSSFSGIPANTRVNMITAGVHDENEVFAVFNNHRAGDFKPYVMRSTNKGKTWTSISSNLPERGSAFAIRQDHKDPNLLFVGTEFGAYFSNDAGQNWTKLSGLPTIAVYDLDIQERENDLVAATFGRGFYVLDNYSPLRSVTKKVLDKDAHLFPIKEALMYIPSAPLGLRGTGSQGADLWNAENPMFGAVFTLYLKDKETSLKNKRVKKQEKQEKDKIAVDYPSFDQLKAEKLEDKAQLIWIIRDDSGKEIKRLKSSPKKGISRMAWNLRGQSTSPVSLKVSKPGRYSDPDDGFLVNPGTYTVEIVQLKDGALKTIAEKTSFVVKELNNRTIKLDNVKELEAFRNEVAELTRSVDGTGRLMGETSEKLKYMEHALKVYPGTDMSLLTEVEDLKNVYHDLTVEFWGDRIRSSHEFETEPSISGRIGMVSYQLSGSRTGVTATHRKNKAAAEELYNAYRVKFNAMILRVKALEKKLDDAKIPYIKGKDENWKED
ncbi:MAG: glycosyl hydrolase [Crocinitomicaceae bacterium]|nr:glycosyl hydrolase [Crocinitomicaceae bacterium]